MKLKKDVVKKSINHAVFLCFDSFGDQVLRQPLFTQLCDDGYRVTVVIRSEYEKIIPFLDERLRVLSVTSNIDPYILYNVDLESIKNLITEIKKLQPTLLICPSYNNDNYLDKLICSLFPDIESFGFVGMFLTRTALELQEKLQNDNMKITPNIFTKEVQCDEEDHECVKYQALLKAITNKAADNYVPEIKLTTDIENAATEILQTMGLKANNYVIGCPIGSMNVAIKSWPLESYVAMAEYLQQKYKLPILMVGVSTEQSQLDELQKMGTAKGITIYSWIGTKENQDLLLGLIKNSKLYLGTDTGVMHFASALDIPIVSMFGGGTWPRFLPTAKNYFIATQKLPCFGCGWRCYFLDEHPLCINLIDDVILRNGIDKVLTKQDNQIVNFGQDLIGVYKDLVNNNEKNDNNYKLLSRKILAVFKSQNKLNDIKSNKIKLLKMQLQNLAEDSMSRLQQVHILTQQLKKSEIRLQEMDTEHDRQMFPINKLLLQIKELETRLQESDADREKRLFQIKELEIKLQESDTDREKRLLQVNELVQRLNKLETRLQESDIDRTNRLAQIEILTRQLQESEIDRANRLLLIEDLTAKLNKFTGNI